MSEPDYICKYLDISTRHISKEDLEILINLGSNPYGVPIVYGYPEGGWLFNSQVGYTEDLKEAGLSEHMNAIFDLASRYDCQFIRFDCDGPTIPDLTVFDWEEDLESQEDQEEKNTD